MNNNLQDTIGLPSTDNRTWNNEFNVGDIVRVKKEFGITTKGKSVYRKILSYSDNAYAVRPENPKGRLYSLEEGGGWEGKDLEPMPIGKSMQSTPSIQPNQALTTRLLASQSATQNGMGLYQNALLTALNVSAKVQATLPKELMDAAYIIYELQKVYAATPEGQQKNQLALAISEGSRILLSEINNMPSKQVQTTIVPQPPPQPPTPPTPPPPSQPPPPPTPPTSRTYKVGDKFKESDDMEVPPIYIYTITEINNVYNTVTFTLFRRNTNTTVTNTEDSSDWELYLSNGELVPYVEPTTVTPPPPPPTPPPPTPPPPKPKKPKTPKPTISNTPVINFSCKEIKDAIKGLTLLVDFGDDTVLDEINELKQLLKTQNCK